MSSVLLSTAYWPNLQYFYYVLNFENVFIESHEHYQKQSFRNRAQILTANGVLDLTIPVQSANKVAISSVEISYKENWQANHWRAITSAYKNSPYFEFFEDEIRAFYAGQPQYLFQYNSLQLKTVLKIMRIKKEIHFTANYQKEIKDVFDLREKIHPKINFTNDLNTKAILEKPYYQTFGEKFPFQPNLSILDLLFNKGLGTIEYLNKREFQKV